MSLRLVTNIAVCSAILPRRRQLASCRLSIDDLSSVRWRPSYHGSAIGRFDITISCFVESALHAAVLNATLVTGRAQRSRVTSMSGLPAPHGTGDPGSIDATASVEGPINVPGIAFFFNCCLPAERPIEARNGLLIGRKSLAANSFDKRAYKPPPTDGPEPFLSGSGVLEMAESPARRVRSRVPDSNKRTPVGP